MVQWTLTDHLNTVRDIAKYDSQTDTTTVVNHLVYDAFGRVTSETDPAVDSLFLFTARPFDAETKHRENLAPGAFGQQLTPKNLNRWYDAGVGRWLREDPIGFGSRDINAYRYVGNSATAPLDANGLQAAPTVRIYDTPTGVFAIEVTILRVQDPAQQLHLGETVTGYIVRYQAPPGVCNRPTERIHLTQAIHTRGFFTGDVPHFEAAPGTLAGTLYPPYPGQTPGGLQTLADSPYNTRTLGVGFHDVCVCAICTTTCELPGGYAVSNQQILGCVNFVWRDREPPTLIFHGKNYRLYDKIWRIPAENPGSVWQQAEGKRNRR